MKILGRLFGKSSRKEVAVETAPQSVVSDETKPTEKPAYTYQEPEYTSHLWMRSKIGEDAPQGEILGTLGLMAKFWDRKEFWPPHSAEALKEDFILEAVKGPNKENILQFYALAKKACNKFIQPREPSAFEEEVRGLTVLLTPETMAVAPIWLRDFVQKSQILFVEIAEWPYYQIRKTSAVPVSLFFNRGAGRAGIGIGTLSERDLRYSQNLTFNLDVRYSESYLDFSFFASAFKPSKELLAFLQELGSETKRFDVFLQLAKHITELIEKGTVQWLPIWAASGEPNSRYPKNVPVPANA